MMRRKGFTLVELVVVILILGILAGVAAPKMFNTSAKATDNGLKQTLGIVRDAIELYQSQNGGALPTLQRDGTDFMTGSEAVSCEEPFPKSPVGPAPTAGNASRARPTARRAADRRVGCTTQTTGEFILQQRRRFGDRWVGHLQHSSRRRCRAVSLDARMTYEQDDSIMTPRGKALVVDDNVALARVTQFALTRAGFDARIAGNGRKALEFAQAESFDIVISDQQMPEMTGLELCRRLRATEEYAQTPIILLTAKGLELELPAFSASWTSTRFSRSPSALGSRRHRLPIARRRGVTARQWSCLSPRGPLHCEAR